MVVLENCKGTGSRMPIIGPVDCQKQTNKQPNSYNSCNTELIWWVWAAIKDVKMTRMTSKRLPYRYLAYNTREEDKHRRISVVYESRNVRHAKRCYATFFWQLWVFADLLGRFGRFDVNTSNVNAQTCSNFEIKDFSVSWISAIFGSLWYKYICCAQHMIKYTCIFLIKGN